MSLIFPLICHVIYLLIRVHISIVNFLVQSTTLSIDDLEMYNFKSRYSNSKIDILTLEIIYKCNGEYNIPP